jgi:hypothetical protein
VFVLLRSHSAQFGGTELIDGDLNKSFCHAVSRRTNGGIGRIERVARRAPDRQS